MNMNSDVPPHTVHTDSQHRMIGEVISELLSQDLKSVSLIEIYIEIQRAAESRFGEHTVVLMEVGSFFEVYGVDNDEMRIGKPKEVAHMLNLQLTRKNKSIIENSVQNPLLAGFPGASFERYMQRLMQEQQYTVVVIRQRGEPPTVERYLDRILSPGVNFDYATDEHETIMSSVLIDKNKEIYSVGFSAIDIRTGQTNVQEVHGTSEDPTRALDELFGLIHSQHTAELVVTLLSDDIAMYDILQYLEIYNTPPVHTNTHRLRIEYQNELFKKVYRVESQLSPIEYFELEKAPLASEALALLIEFVMEHDVHVVHQLLSPQIIYTNDELYLGNNPLEQLDIISRHTDSPSVLRLLDKTTTSMGRRLLTERLRHPSTSSSVIEQRYNLVESISAVQEELRVHMRNIYDLERLQRRIVIQRLHPFEINFVYESLVAIQQAYAVLPDSALELADADELRGRVAECLSYFTDTFILDETAKVLHTQIQDSFFQAGINTELDAAVMHARALEAQLAAMQQQIAGLLAEETDNETATDYVQVKQLDKEGHYIHLTKNRYYLIKNQLESLTISHNNVETPFSEFKVKVQTNTVKITGGPITELSEELMTVQAKIARLTRAVYKEQLTYCAQQYADMLQHIATMIARVDVALSTATVAAQYNYVRPQLLPYTDAEGQQLELEQLRHPLVEVHEERGIYVPNNIALKANETRGVLLYGINSSGKSSLMKSVGIAVVLAQAGLYVPASAMRFTPFTELFTRVVARDHFEKGLSSFAVEMMEMRNIFNRCTNRSLILGDEISHGTETISAISIVSAAVLRLEEMGALFICTTHLHELEQIPAMQQLHSVRCMHLAVHYDEAKDSLVFDRVLQDGSGSSIYGLEFARSLHMDEQFIATALDIRKQLIDSYDDVERLKEKKTSKYNKDLYLMSCAVCGNQVDDVHHIRPQQEAKADGRIDHFHKDHKYNLIPLCKKCHNDAHRGALHIHGFKMTSKGLQLEFTTTAE